MLWVVNLKVKIEAVLQLFLLNNVVYSEKKNVYIYSIQMYLNLM